MDEMNKQAELVGDPLLYGQPVQITQSIADVVKRKRMMWRQAGLTWKWQLSD